MANTIDPLGGSYFVEALTNEMEKKALAYIEKIDEMGGIIEAINQGYPQKEVAEAAYNYQRLVDRKDKIVVGVNQYEMEEENSMPILKIDDSVERNQIRRTREVRRKRSARKVNSCIKNLQEAGSTSENLMPVILDAVREYVTLGEICDVLRGVLGEYKDPAYF